MNDQSSRAHLIFGVATAIGASLTVLATFSFAIFGHPFRAVVTLGVGMVALGVLRAAWPGHPWFSARNRWLDAIAYAAVGAVILWLAPWTAAFPPG